MTACDLSERAVQRAILAMCGTCFRQVWITAIPNGAHLAGDDQARFKQMGALKGDGLKVGAPDLLCLWNGGGKLLEVKSRTGRLTDAQQALHPILAEHGWPVSVVRSPEEAFAALEEAGAPVSGRMV